MSTHDIYDKDILKQLTRIANYLENISKTVEQKDESLDKNHVGKIIDITIENSPKCNACEFKNQCFFAYQCLSNDYAYFLKRSDAYDQIRRFF